jgi:hypothetical protein
VEATKGKDDEHEVHLKILQWSAAWSVQGNRASKYQDDILKKKNLKNVDYL